MNLNSEKNSKTSKVLSAIIAISLPIILYSSFYIYKEFKENKNHDFLDEMEDKVHKDRMKVMKIIVRFI